MMFRTAFSALLVAALILSSPRVLSAGPEIEKARKAVYPALVNIAVVGTQYQNGRLRRFPAAGSGVIVSPEGHVLTNYHVAGETTRITCGLPDGRSFEAVPIVLDPLTDLAVLQLIVPAGEDPLPVARLGDSDALNVGDDVLAMGNPMTLSSSMTRGIVSNPHRVFTSFTGAEMEETDLGDGQRTGIFTRWIQHDALILGGNSGGPLVNLEGEVVGINDRGGSGMSFAIPSNIAADVLAEALEHGEIRRGWFGLSFKPVDKMQEESGALVTWVVEGGPAHRAGLQPGDLVVEMDGTPISVRTFEDIPPLLKQLAEVRPGETTSLQWVRPSPGDAPDEHGLRSGRTTFSADLVAAPLEHDLGDQEVIDPWGITVRDVTIQMALARKFPDASGVMVTGVRPGRPGEKAQPRLRQGDVIVSVDGDPVIDLPDLLARVPSIPSGDQILLELRRGRAELLTVLEARDARRSERGGTELPTAWLGVETQVLTRPVAESLGRPTLRGFRITRVYPGTEAERAGFRKGDLITSIDGSALRATRPQDRNRLIRRIESMEVDSSATFEILRDGEPQRLTVLMQATPAGSANAAEAESAILEFTVRDQVFMDAITGDWDRNLDGVIVTAVESGGWASLAGLRPNDLLISLGDIPIPDSATFTRVLDELARERPETVKAFVQRAYRTTFLFMEPDWPAP